MKRALSGARGVFWRATASGSQERRIADGTKERGDWWVRWTCGFGHRPHRKHVGPKSLAIREAERHRLDRPCPEHDVKPAKHLLRDVIAAYLAQSKDKRSHRDDERYGRYWETRFGGRMLDEITAADVEKVKSERLETVKPSTVNRELAFLKHVYNIAIRDEKVDRNPVSRVRLLRECSGRARYLSDEEEARLLAALPTHQDRDRVSFLIHTGLRKADFLGLQWKNVDFKAGMITIPRTKNGESRHVPMTSVVRAILGRLPRPLDPAALVFGNGVGSCDLRWAEKAFPQAVKAAGINGFRLHDTRHTFASRLAMAGVDLLTIKELGGWKTLTMVQRYAHLSPSHRQSAIERLVNYSTAAAVTVTTRTESHRESHHASLLHRA